MGLFEEEGKGGGLRVIGKDADLAHMSYDERKRLFENVIFDQETERGEPKNKTIGCTGKFQINLK